MNKLLVIIAGTAVGLYLLSKNNDVFLPASGAPSSGEISNNEWSLAPDGVYTMQLFTPIRILDGKEVRFRYGSQMEFFSPTDVQQAIHPVPGFIYQYQIPAPGYTKTGYFDAVAKDVQEINNQYPILWVTIKLDGQVVGRS